MTILTLMIMNADVAYLCHYFNKVQLHFIDIDSKDYSDDKIIQNIEDSDDVSNTRKGGPLAKYEAVLKEQLTVYTPMSYNARIVGKYVLSLIACSGQFKRSLQT